MEHHRVIATCMQFYNLARNRYESKWVFGESLVFAAAWLEKPLSQLWVGELNKWPATGSATDLELL